MPRVFEKNCKVKVIEYGEHCFQPITFKKVLKMIKGFFRI